MEPGGRGPCPSLFTSQLQDSGQLCHFPSVGEGGWTWVVISKTYIFFFFFLNHTAFSSNRLLLIGVKYETLKNRGINLQKRKIRKIKKVNNPRASCMSLWFLPLGSPSFLLKTLNSSGLLSLCLLRGSLSLMISAPSGFLLDLLTISIVWFPHTA